MKYLKTPNLPENLVDTVIANYDMSECAQNRLMSEGIRIIDTHKSENTDIYISKHADISIIHLGNADFLCEPESVEFYRKVLPDTNVCTGNKLSDKYPYDVAYNAAVLLNCIVCKEGATSPEIIEYAKKKGLTLINTAQGYTKCNVSIISDNSIITSDINICKTVRKFGIDVLFVDDSSVLLKGYNHGFFGGATGKISPDKLVVNGNIKTHKSCDEIIKFASRYDVEIISLCNSNIEDIGSILPISEI